LSEIEVVEKPHQWKPFPRQSEFLALPTSIYEALFGGAAGPGKSEVLLMDPVVRGYHLHPRFHGIVFRETYKQLDESLIMRAKQLYEPLGGGYNGNEHCWTFPSGAKMRFSYLAKDSDAVKYDTAEFTYAGFDELTALSEYRYKYIAFSRVRKSVANLPCYVRAASNPGGIGHTWVRDRFVKPAINGRTVIREILDDGRIVKRIFIPGRVTDNLHIMKHNPEYVNNLMMLPEAEKRTKLYGDWFALAGAVFTEFRNLRMPDEPAHALHVIDPFAIPGYWPKIMAIDWGFSALCWIGWFAISPQSNVFLYRERGYKKTKIAIWASEVARISQFDENIKRVKLDPSAWGNRGEEKTLDVQIKEHLGMTPEKGDNDRIGGKMLMHEFFRWKERPQRYVPEEGYKQEVEELIYRQKGAGEALKYRELFAPDEPEVNLPKFRIFNHCNYFIDAIQSCVYDPDNPEDVKPFDGDDPYDGGRYGIKAIEKYFQESKSGFEAANRAANIVQQFKDTGDMTNLYRQMETLEARERKNKAPARRNGSWLRRRGL
jgi:hypothetical protein